MLLHHLRYFELCFLLFQQIYVNSTFKLNWLANTHLYFPVESLVSSPLEAILWAISSLNFETGMAPQG